MQYFKGFSHTAAEERVSSGFSAFSHLEGAVKFSNYLTLCNLKSSSSESVPLN
jgi:hypothetical protein